MLANNFFGDCNKLYIFLFLAELEFFILFISSLLKEKKAISEPDIKAEQAINIRSTPISIRTEKSKGLKIVLKIYDNIEKGSPGSSNIIY